MRSFWISLLFLGLLAAGVDGFRDRERVRVGAPSSPMTTIEDGELHHAEFGIGIPPR